MAGLALKRREEHRDELWTEAVPERDHRVLELLQADATAAVHVELVEQVPPRGEVAPQRDELVEDNDAVPVAVEHADHHLDGARVEGGVVSVDEGGAQFHLRQRAGL